jgi:CYTH domain-containing protein
MEIERKYLVDRLPEDLSSWEKREIEQGYICEDPVLRIRKSGEHFSFVYKSSGLLAHEEIALPLDKDAYNHLKEKADGKLIKKTRYVKSLDSFGQASSFGLSSIEGLKIELDQFHNVKGPDGSPLLLAEVEFKSREDADKFIAPSWFKEDVTLEKRYHNSEMIFED